jgi:hypothetical protein
MKLIPQVNSRTLETSTLGIVGLPHCEETGARELAFLMHLIDAALT